jgi:hypothetical protein
VNVKTFNRTIWLLSALLVALSAGTLLAEHPTEHPTEHPSEHPTEHPQGGKVSKDNLAEAIEAYVEHEAELKGGYFLVFDPKSEKPLVLTLKKVHKERLANISKGVYFACADFVTPNGKVYDLDIFMEGPDAGDLTVTEVAVHKESGKARYNWQEKRGVWKKKSL